MAQLISTKDVDFFIHEGDLRAVNTEDGVGHYPLSNVCITIIATGKSYIYPKCFLASLVDFGDDYGLMTSKGKCDNFIAQLKEAGKIDLESWQEYQLPEMDLEAEWNAAAADEALERQGYYR